MVAKRPTPGFLLLLMVLVLLYAGTSGSLAGQSPTDPTQNEDGWLERIIALSNEHHSSYQVLLWKSFHVLNELLNDAPHPNRSWGRTEANMKRLGLPFIFGNEQADPTYCRCFVKKEIGVDQAGRSYELCLDFLINAKTNEIYSADPCLVFKVNEPLGSVIRHDVFQENVAIDRLLTLPIVKAQAVTFPYLKSVELTYKSLKDADYGFGYNGFLVDLNLEGDHTGEKLSYGVASGLDPCVSPSTHSQTVNDLPLNDILLRDDVRSLPKLDEVGRPGVFWDAGKETWNGR